MTLTIGLTVLVTVLVTLLLLLFAMSVMYAKEKARLLSTLRLYFESPGPEIPSEFAKFMDIVAYSFAKKCVDIGKTSFMGMQSVDSKNLSRIEGDILQDEATRKSPLLGAIMGSYPTLARRLVKNPGLLPLIEQVMGNMTVKKTAGPVDNGVQKKMDLEVNFG